MVRTRRAGSREENDHEGTSHHPHRLQCSMFAGTLSAQDSPGTMPHESRVAHTGPGGGRYLPTAEASVSRLQVPGGKGLGRRCVQATCPARRSLRLDMYTSPDAPLARGLVERRSARPPRRETELADGSEPTRRVLTTTKARELDWRIREAFRGGALPTRPRVETNETLRLVNRRSLVSFLARFACRASAMFQVRRGASRSSVAEADRS